MGRENKSKNLCFLSMLWAVAAIMLLAAPSLQAQVYVDVPSGEEWYIDYTVPGTLRVYGIANILPGAVIQGDVIATDNSTVNITGGTVTAGWWVDVAPLANVTVYGTDFEIGEVPQLEGDVKINGILTVNTGSETEFSMEFQCTTGAAVTLAAPVVGSPEELIEQLIADVEALNLNQGIDNSLDAKLQNALDALEAANAGQRQDAVNKMNAFISAVAAQSGKALTSEEADILIALAQDIIDLL